MDSSALDGLVDAVLARHRGNGTRLMQILREVQEVCGWLPPEALTRIAAAIGWPRVRVASTAAFYAFFHTVPMGRYRILWSDNITDRMLGSRQLIERMCEKLWVEQGRVSEDGLVSVDTTSCTGMGDQGPALLANYRAVTRMTAQRVDAMADLIRAGVPVSDWPAEWFAVEDNIRRQDALLAHGMVPGGSAGRRAGAAAAGAARRDSHLQTARPRWRRLRHGAEMGSLPQRAGHRDRAGCGALRRLQRRRG
jgi:[NiFe] hydrogenase diaphorase moiety large subunit